MDPRGFEPLFLLVKGSELTCLTLRALEIHALGF